MAIKKQAVTKRYANQIERMHKKLGIAADYGQLRELELQPEAKRLVYAGMEPRGRDHFLDPKAFKAWNKMKKAAKKDGHKILLISGFRSVVRQQYLIEEQMKRGETLEQVLTRLAAPGYTEHHTGRALDLATPEDPHLDERFEETATFKWLAEHAKSFGFSLSYPRNNVHRFIYEPWHWFFSES